MPSHKYTTITEYIELNGADETLKKRMIELHNFFCKHLAQYKVEHNIGYNIPVYLYRGRPAVYWNMAKNYLSLQIPPYGLYQYFAKELANYTTTKSALHLLHKNAIDYNLLTKILDYRIQEMEKFESKKFKK
jgi:uncharacterized protein YdhG (YjbR/CyaY superfamily)